MQTKLDSANAEISSLKIQLSTALFEEGSRPTTSIEPPNNTKVTETEVPPKNIRVKIQQDSTASLFGGSLFVTVVATDYEGDPLGVWKV